MCIFLLHGVSVKSSTGLVAKQSFEQTKYYLCHSSVGKIIPSTNFYNQYADLEQFI